MMRTGHGPANNAAISNMALAIILGNGYQSVPEATDRYEANRGEAAKEILGKRPRTPG